MKKTFEGLFERNEGKHARQAGTVVVKETLTKEEKKAERRKTRFILVEGARLLVTTLFLFVVATGDSIFFPFVILLAATGLLSLLEYEADFE